MRFFHYTKGVHMPSIINDGEIKTTAVGIACGERPIAWVSTNEDWKYTVNADLDKDELAKMAHGLYRIEVTPAFLHPWDSLKMLAQIPPAVQRSLEQVAREDRADPADWWGCLKPIPRDRWLRVEKLTENGWQEVAEVPAIDFEIKLVPVRTPWGLVKTTGRIARLGEGMVQVREGMVAQ
jgi:hypothetical protein